MHKIFIILFFGIFLSINAQTSAPKLINYQGIARDPSGIPITTPFDLHFVIKDATSTVHDEIQTGIQPNQHGLFSTQIGLAPNTLTLTNWTTGPFTLDIHIKTGSTFTFVGNQQLVSVPFALFAGTVPSSYTNNVLTIGNNSYSITSGSAITPTINGTGLVTVTPNTGPVYTVDVPPPSLSYVAASNQLSLTQGSVVSTVALIGTGSSTISIAGSGVANVNPLSGSAFTVTVPPPAISFSGNILSISQGTAGSTATFNPTLSGDVTGGLSTTTVSALQNTPVSTLPPLNGQILTFTGGSWTPVTPTVAAVSPWQKIGNNVTLVTPTDLVGLGLSSPNAKLDVIGTPTTSSAIINANNINASSTFPAIQALSNGGPAVIGTETSAGGANAGDFSSNNGTGVAASSNANNSSSPAILANSSSTNTSNYAGVFNGGIVSKGKTSTSSGFALTTQNAALTTIMVARNDGNVGIGTNAPNAKLNVVENASLAAVNVSNPGGDGVNSNVGNGRSYYAQNNSGANAAIEAINNGAGNTILATKQVGTSNGNAARIINFSTTNGADAVFAQTNGAGAAIHAVNGPSVTGGSNAALILEDGHVKLKQTSSPSISMTTSSGGPFNLLINCTDVAGTLNFTTGPSGPFPGNSAYPRVTFSKAYLTPPVVILTPKSYPAAQVPYYVTVTSGYFEINIYSGLAASSFYEYNYMVIEGK